LAFGAQGAERKGLRNKATGFVRALEFQHRLRVCNAYPYAAPIDLLRGKEKLTQEPMPYKTCNDFSTNLKAGDKIEFRVGDANAGTFSVADLPQNDAVLLLVIHRHDTLSTAVNFESHVFANLMNAQVAVIDTYKGSAKSTVKIQDEAKSSESARRPSLSRKEDLRYDSVVAVNPGEYVVSLSNSDGSDVDKQNLVALNRESYILLRVGIEAQQGQQYPQELMVYPKSDPSSLHSGAFAKDASVTLLVGVYVMMFLL